MISQADIDRGKVVKEGGRVFLDIPALMKPRVRIRQLEGQSVQRWARHSARWTEFDFCFDIRVGDTVMERTEPLTNQPLFSKRGRVVALNEVSYLVDVCFPGRPVRTARKDKLLVI